VTVGAEPVIDALIDRTGYGLAPGKWRAQLKAIRALPETNRPENHVR
jgi:hypothetical protein